MDRTHMILLSALAVLLLWRCTHAKESFDQLPLLTTQQFLDMTQKYGPPDDISTSPPAPLQPAIPKRGLIITAEGKRYARQ